MTDEKTLLEFAVQQFTGYAAAIQGGANPLMELVESMGLTANEYRAIRKDIQWMPHRDLAELDGHFGLKKEQQR